jgi:hypothetical protein
VKCGSTSGGSGKLLSTLKGAYCSALPSGSVTGVTGSTGGIGGVPGSLEMVVNYNSGQVSFFASGGVAAGSVSATNYTQLSNLPPLASPLVLIQSPMGPGDALMYLLRRPCN